MIYILLHARNIISVAALIILCAIPHFATFDQSHPLLLLLLQDIYTEAVGGAQI